MLKDGSTFSMNKMLEKFSNLNTQKLRRSSQHYMVTMKHYTYKYEYLYMHVECVRKKRNVC